MNIGVLKEIKRDERRVALQPIQAKVLLGEGTISTLKPELARELAFPIQVTWPAARRFCRKTRF